MSQLEESLAFQIRAVGLPAPEREYRFHDKRRWRADFAWPDMKLIAEVEGATWAGGRHTRGAGFEADADKYNTAALDGWTVLRFTGNMIKSGLAIQHIQRAFDLWNQWQTISQEAALSKKSQDTRQYTTFQKPNESA